MPSLAINNLTAPDTYTAASTLYPLPLLDHINIDVQNAAIYWQIAETNPLTTVLSGAWNSEVFMIPGSRTLTRGSMVGVRFRAAIPTAQLPVGAIQAQVTIEAVG
jgi:hypothetical protein